MAKQNHRARVGADTDGTQPKADPEGRPPAGLGSCVVDLANTLARGTANLMARHGLIPLDLAVPRLFLTKEEWTTSQLVEMLPVNASRMSGQVSEIVGMGLTSRPTPALPPAARGSVAAG